MDVCLKVSILSLTTVIIRQKSLNILKEIPRWVDVIGATQVGTWDKKTGLHLYKKHVVRFSGDQDIVLDFQSNLQNRTIRVVTVEDPPFVMVKDPSMDQRNVTKEDLEGNCYSMLAVSLY